MIYKSKNEIAIGSTYKTEGLSLDNLKRIEDLSSFHPAVEEEQHKFAYVLEHYGRVLRVIEFLNSFNGKEYPSLFGRIYNVIGKNKDKKILRKEFYAFKIDDLDKNIGRISGDVLMEFVILDETEDMIKKLLDYTRLCKSRYDIYTFNDIDLLNKYLDSSYITKITVPSFLKQLLK